MAVEHNYAEILRAIADGKEIEIRDGHGWKDIDDHEVLRLISEDWQIEPRLVRVKPELIEKTVKISSPIPITVEPKDGTVIYYPTILSDDMVTSCCWGRRDWQLLALERGLIHLTEEAAREHAKVLISLTQPE